MRPPWLQPVDPMIPMLPEDRARMHCLGPRDCYLNQTGREGFKAAFNRKRGDLNRWMSGFNCWIEFFQGH